MKINRKFVLLMSFDFLLIDERFMNADRILWQIKVYLFNADCLNPVLTASSAHALSSNIKTSGTPLNRDFTL